MTQVQTPTFLLEDRYGAVHELDGNDRVLVLARNQLEAHRWIIDQGDHPYGRRFLVSPDPRALDGARVHCVVTLPGFDFNPRRRALEDIVERIANRTVNFRRIDG